MQQLTLLVALLFALSASAQAVAPGGGGGSDACTGKACSVASLTVTATSSTVGATFSQGASVKYGTTSASEVYADEYNNVCVGRPSGGRASGNLFAQVVYGYTIVGDGSVAARGYAGFINDQTGFAARLSDPDGTAFIPVSAMPTQACGTAYVPEGTVLAFAAAASNPTRLCFCTSDGGGTPAYRWQNITPGHATAGQYGTSTTCP